MKMFIRSLCIIFPAIIIISFHNDSRSEYFLPESPVSVYAADLDQDGDNDIITGHVTGYENTNPSISILENNGHGSFKITDTSKVFCGYQDNILAIDVDKDGWPDIAAMSVIYVAEKDYENIRIYYNDHGEFPFYSDFFLDNPKTVTYWTHGDINGDGYPDFAFTSNWGFCFGVLYNDGTGHYGTPEYVSLDLPPNHILCSDLDNDGRDDVILHNNKVFIYYKLEDGWDVRNLTDSAFYPDDLNVADFDQDGLNDVVTNKSYYYIDEISHVKMFKNLGNKTFQLISSFKFHGSGKIFPADFNNDGKPDLMFEGSIGSFLWYNKGNFQFADSTFVPIPYMGEYRRNFYCEDMDNNGFKDILTVRSSIPKIYPNLDIRFNDGHGHFSPSPVSVQNRFNPEASGLKIYPNPFKEKTTITFSLPETSQVEISIIDLRGRFIICFAEKQYQHGTYKIDWQGTDQKGHVCAPGIYIANLKVNNTIKKSVKVVKNP
jgi:hypothetical protein